MNTGTNIIEFILKAAARDSRIIVGGSLKDINTYIPGSNLLIIADKEVHELYSDIFPDFPLIIIESSEQTKSLSTIEHIYKQFLEQDVDRDTFILAIGGGVLCDIAGFAASTYLRGLRYAFVATTLLAQVDASVGGKNGVNFNGIKNIIGVFNQPEFVICDHDLLKTLDKEEFLSGLGEVLKYGFIGDPEILAYFGDDSNAGQEDTGKIHDIVVRSLRIKKQIVENDELETGLRRLLNFGHSFGHAIESTAKIPHGIAISYGMLAAIYISARKGYMSDGEAKKATHLIKGSGVLKAVSLDPAMLRYHFAADKKRSGRYLYFVMLKNIGEAFTEKLEADMLFELFEDWLNKEVSSASGLITLKQN